MSKNLADNNAKSNKAANNMVKDGKCNLKGSQKLRPHRVGKGVRRALIVENMQNCFFQGGSVGFRDKGDEKALLKKVNKLISLHEVDDNYVLAGKTGREKTNMFGTKNSGVDTGSRKKFFFDTIIFTQDGNPPDHWTFASHHYLRKPEEFDYFSGSTKGKKKTYKCKGVRCKRKSKLLLPDHALTDGTDRYKMDGKERIGIEFHPKLDVRSLYRPNTKFHHTSFIKKPIYKNRGFIVFKGNSLGDARSAFKNTLDKKTGLDDFLKCNKINSIFVCGMGRENTVKNTLLDSTNLSFIKERILVYDATLPVGLDLVEDKSVYKKTIKGNTFVKQLRNKKIVVIQFSNISTNVSGGVTIHDREEPKGAMAKRISKMDNLFSTAVKK
jgi:nicotinamidase-related amidase